LLKEVGVESSKRFGVEHRVIVLDVSREDSSGDSPPPLTISTSALSSSNAGTGNPGEFLKLDRQLLQANLRLSTMAHLEHLPPFRRETRQAGEGRLDPRRGQWVRKRRSLYGE